MRVSRRRTLPKGVKMEQGVPTLQIPKVSEADRIPIGQSKILEVREQQVNQLNNTLRQRWKRGGRKGVAPRIEFVARPDNPWRDRYLLCQDCERRADLKALPPREECNNSTFLELDMTAPFSRDNVMVCSCHLIQMIREDVRVRKLGDGTWQKVEGKKVPGSFPVQVCAVCRKTSLDEGRRFMQCMTCHGVSYCSKECYAKHRMQHRASCTIPELPYREEWGVRKPLRKMRNEIYPLVHKWAIREPSAHRIAWLPPPEHQRKLLDNRKPIRPMLPGFSGGNSRRLLPMAPTTELEVEEGGKIALYKERRQVRLQRKQPRRMRSAEPDPVQLLNLGMTREEFLAKEQEVTARVAREDEEATAMIIARQEAMEPVSSFEDTAPAGPIELSEEAVQRLQNAADEAPVEPVNPDVRPPWEILADEEAEQLGGRREWVKKKVAPKGMPSEEEKKDGVVYKESFIRAKYKKKGLKLSEEALQRLEEAAALAGGDEIKFQDYNDPRYKHSMF